MERLTGFEKFRGPCALSIGNFDGVHLGHQAILQTLVTQARAASVPAVVLTFEPHPTALLKPERLPPRLTTRDEKAVLIARCGVDVLIEYPTDWALLSLSPRAFFDQIVSQQCQAKTLVEGPNFFFGQGRSGELNMLETFCRETGGSLTIVPPLQVNERLVSSSRIREAILQGDLTSAALMLGRRYSIQGIVSAGAGRGRTLGFPTANLEQIETLLPQQGVYAAWCRLPDGDYPTAVNIGPNPTFADLQLKVEAHLIGASADLYGQKLSLEFVSRLRGLKTFASREELQIQIDKDVADTKSLCAP